MISWDIQNYLATCSGLTALLPASKIFTIQAPTDTELPYLVVELSEGPREKIGAQLTEGRPYCRVTVDGGPASIKAAGAIAEKARSYLENYRGAMGNSNDVMITCSEVRGWAGTGGAFRYQFSVNARYTEARSVP
jgi:hypothetical protein